MRGCFADQPCATTTAAHNHDAMMRPPTDWGVWPTILCFLRRNACQAKTQTGCHTLRRITYTSLSWCTASQLGSEPRPSRVEPLISFSGLCCRLARPLVAPIEAPLEDRQICSGHVRPVELELVLDAKVLGIAAVQQVKEKVEPHQVGVGQHGLLQCDVETEHDGPSGGEDRWDGVHKGLGPLALARRGRETVQVDLDRTVDGLLDRLVAVLCSGCNEPLATVNLAK
mmetsp:Transcript_6483/g.20986  ORF Transcript_6483/g.20986 Transcript_6483/m.20986 type:complete len:227 (-) Transcript_6483:218-898(-)